MACWLETILDTDPDGLDSDTLAYGHLLKLNSFQKNNNNNNNYVTSQLSTVYNSHFQL